MSELISRLRKQADRIGVAQPLAARLYDEAADEIKRLADAYNEEERRVQGLNIKLGEAKEEAERLQKEVENLDQIRGMYNDLSHEADRLRKIVDSLPKTANESPIWPGKTVYRFTPGLQHQNGKQVRPQQETIQGVCINSAWTAECPSDDVPFGDLFDTYEDAEKATKMRVNPDD